MDFQQSNTYNNIMNSLNIEQVANTQYQIYADRAREEGFIEIGSIFDIIARNVREYARIWLKQINNGELPTTEENLRTSAEYEAYAGNTLYREYAQVAREEGYDNIAALFNGIANIKLNHNLIFSTQYEDVIRGEVFCKPTETLWICIQCGNIMSGICAPEICPICGFPQGYYRVYNNRPV